MRPSFLCCVILLVAAATPVARADTTWCVNNATSFQQALNAARDDDTIIKVWRGEYVTLDIRGGTFQDDLDHNLTVLGGYSDAACSEAGRSLDPALTVFRPVTIGGAYSFDLYVDGDLLLKSLTLRGYGRGVDVASTTSLFGSDTRWTLDRVRIERSGGALFEGAAQRALLLAPGNDASLRLHQVVLADNASSASGCSAQVFTEEDVVVQQSTFARNAGTALCINGDPGAPLDVDNTIFWNNALGLAVHNVSSANFHLRHNTLDGTAFTALPSIDVGNNSFDPQFLDPAAGDYRLAGTSPAINSGVMPPSGGQTATDIVGNPRVVGGIVDRGPWETDVSNATVLVVTTTAGAGAGSLASAIEQSNTTPGTQVIRFAIPGSCPQVIFQFAGQGLPDITDSVRIEGYSQPGSVPGVNGPPTICVGLWGNQELSTLMRVFIGGDNVSLDVSGIGFGGTTFASGAAALTLLAGSGHQVSGNQFGGFIGPPANPVALNVLQNGIVAGFAASNVFIGGSDPAQRNYFNSANAAAIDIGSSTVHPANVQVLNNYIGPKPLGLGTDGNTTGVVLRSTDGNFVNGNWISGNRGDGVLLSNAGTTGNIIAGNQIGRCPACLTPPFGSEPLLPNGGNGVHIRLGAHDNLVIANAIAGNVGAGIVDIDGLSNLLGLNRIYRNGALGIDIGGDGVTPNNTSAQTGDGVQNHPVIGLAGGGFYDGTVSGGLTAPPGQTYVIEVYQSDACDPSGRGEGQRSIGATAVTTPPSPIPGFYSTASFSVAVSSTGLADRTITAVARNEAGDTSEFSPCASYLYSDVIFQDDFE